MAIIKAGSISRGMFLRFQGNLVLVVDKEFFNPGKGAAVVRLKLKNLQTGRVRRQVLKTDEAVEPVEVDHRRLQYLYRQAKNFVFMDPQTYEQIEVDGKLLLGMEGLLKEGETYLISFYQQEPLSVQPPKKMVLRVAKTQAAVKGDTVTVATKEATLETGLTVHVPLFIKRGEKIIINCERREYVSRASSGQG